jgi:hypothetical protein
MKSSRFGVSLLCLSAMMVVVSAVASAAGADTKLRWKFAKGEKLGYALSQKTSVSMEATGKKMETSFTQAADMTWEVKEIDKEGNALMVQTIDRFRFRMTVQGKEIELDTAKAEDPPGAPEAMTKLFRALVGSPFTMKITPRGEIRDFKVPARVLEAFKTAGPDGAMFGSEENLRNMAGQSLVPFPEAAVAPGKSWNIVRKLPMQFGTMVMDIKYTLEAATSPIENIGIEVKATVEPKEGVPVEVKVTSQDAKGHFRFDNSAGVLTKSDLVQKMSMTVTISGQQFPQDVETTTKFELKKDRGSN